MGPYILIVVVYSPEKTIGTLVGVSSTLFSSNLKKEVNTFSVQFLQIIRIVMYKMI